MKVYCVDDGILRGQRQRPKRRIFLLEEEERSPLLFLASGRARSLRTPHSAVRFLNRPLPSQPQPFQTPSVFSNHRHSPSKFGQSDVAVDGGRPRRPNPAISPALSPVKIQNTPHHATFSLEYASSTWPAFSHPKRRKVQGPM